MTIGRTLKTLVGIGLVLGATAFGAMAFSARASAQEQACGAPRAPGELAITGVTTPPVAEGTARIPELGLTSQITGGCFEFRNLTLPRGPMLISLELKVDGYRPMTYRNWVVLDSGGGPIFTPTLEPGNEAKIVDYCIGLLATDPNKLSAAGGYQAGFCKELPGELALAGGGPAGGPHNTWTLISLLALVGSLCVFAAIRLRGCGARSPQPERFF